MILTRDDDCLSWHTVRPWIDDACTRCDGWWTIEAVVKLLVEGLAQLWVLKDDGKIVAAVVTAIADWDGRKVAEILLTGGSGVVESLDEELPVIERWARDLNAEEVIFRGRRGWARLYKPLGYEEIAVTLRKVL